MPNGCKVDDCERFVKAKGYCEKHYRRWKKNGDPLIVGAKGKKSFLTKEQKKENKKNWTRSLTGRFSELKSHSKARGYEVDITFEQFCKILQNDCFYCDGDFLKLNEQGGYYIDRKDNSKGYVFGNCVPCCRVCNYIKNDNLTVDETLVAVEAIRVYRGLL